MDIQSFKKILRTFIDPGTSIEIDNNNLWIQVNDEILECEISQVDSNIFVTNSGVSMPAIKWIHRSVAKLDVLAHRMVSLLEKDETYIFPNLKCEDVNLSNLESFESFCSLMESETFSILKSNVVYLTSDAGEGKTSFLNELTLVQSKKFLKGESNYIIVPVSLGGRTFHRFDDIIIGVLANRFRFPFLNYDAFIEMIRQGCIVLALDGFEEMFVETGSGEALSAMGILLKALDSSGKIIVSARKAYYEFENLKIQPKLFDIIKDYDVQFYKIDIERWDKYNFLDYSEKVGLDDPNEIYRKTTEILSNQHPILTRPVLAKKFVELIRGNGLDTLLPILRDSGNESFKILVESIVEREASEKWLGKSGSDQIHKPLLSLEGHLDLLSMLAYEMWTSKKDYLTSEVVNFVVDMFAEIKHVAPEITGQVRERIKGHSLFIISKNDARCIEFDHEEFKDFFLSRQIAKLIINSSSSLSSRNNLISALRISLINDKIKSQVTSFLIADDITDNLILELETISIVDGVNSYLHQNTADLLMKVLSIRTLNSTIILKGYNFGMNALKAVRFKSIQFIQCNFASTNLETSLFKDCFFDGCNFDSFPIHETTKFDGTKISNCAFVSIEYLNKKYFDPHSINKVLRAIGVLDSAEVIGDDRSNEITDVELIHLEKVLRYFLRSTHMSESVIKMKLGNQASSTFFTETLPELIEIGIFVEIANKGGVVQKRFRLGYDMSKIEASIEKSKGSFEEFKKNFKDY